MDKKTRGRILLVDDEEDILYVLKKGLESKGFTVDAYNEPQKVLAEFKAGAYDLLLIDIKMSGMTGFELYRKIEKIDPVVKICFITAFEIYYDEFRRVFPRIKVSCFVKKPVSIEKLSEIIEAELGIEAQVSSVMEPPRKGG